MNARLYRHPETGDRAQPSNDPSGDQYADTLERAGYQLLKGEEAEESEVDRLRRELAEAREATAPNAADESKADKAKG